MGIIGGIGEGCDMSGVRDGFRVALEVSRWALSSCRGAGLGGRDDEDFRDITGVEVERIALPGLGFTTAPGVALTLRKLIVFPGTDS